MASRRCLLWLALLGALLIGACGSDSAAPKSSSSGASSLPQGGDPVQLNAADFVAVIDHPYWPMKPGAKWVYTETDKESTQRIEITVTEEKKAILGIQATVVHDVVTEDDQLVEDTWDWYAQDTAGNLWYLGEDTKEYENGVLKSTEGSWEAGVDGAQAGILLAAHPQPGLTYRQEYYKGEAEDVAEVVSINEQAAVPFGSFDHVLMTKDTTPLEPRLVEQKYYARDVGLVLTVQVGGSSRSELVSYTPP